MERIKMLILLLILVVAVILIIKYWKTGKRS